MLMIYFPYLFYTRVWQIRKYTLLRKSAAVMSYGNGNIVTEDADARSCATVYELSDFWVLSLLWFLMAVLLYVEKR